MHACISHFLVLFFVANLRTCTATALTHKVEVNRSCPHLGYTYPAQLRWSTQTRHGGSSAPKYGIPLSTMCWILEQ